MCGKDFPLRDGTSSQCNPTGMNPCCNAKQRNCGNTKEYCVCEDCRDYRPINNRECEVSEVDGFLKYECYDQKYQDHFKCARSDVRYKAVLDTWVDSRGIFRITNASDVCENDPYGYQACGFGTEITSEPSLCGGTFSKDGRYNVQNKSHDHDYFLTSLIGYCNGRCDTEDTCLDESDCEGYSYGLLCNRSGSNIPSLAPVHWICNEVPGCDEELDEENCTLSNSPEEESCVHFYAKTILGKSVTVPIHNFTRCAVFEISKGVYPYCLDFFDQTNCRDKGRIGGICKLKAYNETRTISKSMVCFNKKYGNDITICENGEENWCTQLPPDTDGCLVHKHQMCDNSSDCVDSSDELSDDCKLMTDLKCQRKFGKFNESNKIPVSWLLDGKRDCINGEDEEDLRWEECLILSPTNLSEFNSRYVISREKDRCQDVFICNTTSSTTEGMNSSTTSANVFVTVRLDIMCDGVDSCGLDREVENEVCRYSRDFPTLKKIAPTTGPIGEETTDVCTDVINTKLKGRSCERVEFPPADKIKTFGVSKWLSVPKKEVECKHLYGEFYVYLSCMGRCVEKGATCPLPMVESDTPLRYDACPGQYPDRIYTLAGEKYLTFVTKSNGKAYRNDYFQCENKRCVEYRQVCDLTNDCGDWSDEKSCEDINSVQCSNNNDSRISLKQQCDGIIDCYDLSDECNDKCGKKILEYWSLSAICWFMGILAAIFNLILITRSAFSLKSVRTGNMLETKILIITIAFGDLLNGIYLITIAVFDTVVYGSKYCEQQAIWLSSGTCSLLGVTSTIASQTSLFAMTVLSLTRVVGLTSKSIKAPMPVNKKSILKTSIKVAIILTMSAIIALIPLAPSLEDYFVQGIYYESENNVFIGFPNKERHVNVLRAYFGEGLNASNNMAWKDIHNRMSEIFTDTYETLSWRKVHFYGNDGHCLFKYFVRKDDARRIRQTLEVKTEVVDFIDFEGNVLLWVVLCVNFACFLVMSVSYVLITIQTWKSSSGAGQNHILENVRRKERIQMKISLIIATDFFCWIPFVIICAFHNFQFIDATNWYAYFAMILLPVNSVLNPLLYDNTISGFLERTAKRSKARFSRFARSVCRRNNVFNKNQQRSEQINLEEIVLSQSNTQGNSTVVTSAHEGIDKIVTSRLPSTSTA